MPEWSKVCEPKLSMVYGENANSGRRQSREEAMKRNRVSGPILIALVVAMAAGERWHSNGAFSAQAAEPQGRSLPIFEVDRAWPKVPARWKLGDASSIE